MIIVKIDAGLGNQMLEYCFYRQLKDELKQCTVKVDMDRWIYKKYVPHNGYELNKVFGIELKEKADTREILKCGGEYQRRRPDPIDIIKKRYHNHVGYRLRGSKTVRLHQADWKAFYSLHRDDITEYNCWIDNSWNWIYEPAIADFRYVMPLRERNLEAAEKMKEGDSVSVHIRRGDYVGGVHDILKKDYYINAMGWIGERLKDPVFYFFSDDPEYVHAEYSDLPYKYEVISWNRGGDSHYDMQLMSTCRHNIICNSSFSLWGAVLNDNPDKLVIRPEVLSDELIPSGPGWHTADTGGKIKN